MNRKAVLAGAGIGAAAAFVLDPIGGPFRDDKVSDVRLIERVRAKLARVSSHPRAIDVLAHDGEITLRGPVIASEMDRIEAVVASVRGVRRVIDELDPHESSDGIPSLLGEEQLARSTGVVRQRRWAPAGRALVSASVLATGVCLAAYARRGRHQPSRFASAH